MPVNDCTAFYRPGQDITCQASAALTGCQLVQISGNRTGGPLLSTDLKNVYQVGLTVQGGRAFGVAGYDVANGGLVPVKREGILPVKTGGVIAAAAEVEATAAGLIITASATATRRIVGQVLTGAASGGLAEFELFKTQRPQ